MASVSSSQTATSSEPHTLLFLICHIYPSQHDRPTFFRTCTTVLCCQSANFATTILRLDSPSSKCKFSTVSRSSSPANVIPALAFGTSHSNRPPPFCRLPHRVPIPCRRHLQVPTSLHRQPTTCTNYSASKTSCNICIKLPAAPSHLPGSRLSTPVSSPLGPVSPANSSKSTCPSLWPLRKDTSVKNVKASDPPSRNLSPSPSPIPTLTLAPTSSSCNLSKSPARSTAIKPDVFHSPPVEATSTSWWFTTWIQTQSQPSQ